LKQCVFEQSNSKLIHIASNAHVLESPILPVLVQTSKAVSRSSYTARHTQSYFAIINISLHHGKSKRTHPVSNPDCLVLQFSPNFIFRQWLHGYTCGSLNLKSYSYVTEDVTAMHDESAVGLVELK